MNERTGEWMDGRADGTMERQIISYLSSDRRADERKYERTGYGIDELSTKLVILLNTIL